MCYTEVTVSYIPGKSGVGSRAGRGGGGKLPKVGGGREGPPLDGMLQRCKQEVINTYIYEWYVHDIVYVCIYHGN